VSSESRVLRRLDDWINPIVVKELRQAVQGKFVSAALLLLLTIQLAALGIYIIGSGDFAESSDAGRTAFTFLLAILMAICLIFVPAYTAIRLSFERDTNVDLLFVTTIKPSAIVWGKMFAALTITMLAFSACMPFMVFTYWLRGIDLPSIFVLMTTAFLLVTVAVQVATFVACVHGSRVLKILLSLIAFLMFPQVFIGMLSFAYYSLYSGVGSKLGSWRFWGPASAVLMIAASGIGLLFSLSVAMIKPVSANRALPVRLFVTGMWLVTGVACAAIAYSERDSTSISVWGVLSALVFAASFFVGVSEREQLGPRVVRSIPVAWMRLPAFFLFSGGASGVAWSALMSLATFIVVTLVCRSAAALRSPETQVWVAGLPLYGLAYSMTGLLIRRRVLARSVAPKFTWLIATFLLVLGCTLPFLLGYLVAFGSFRRTEDIGAWLITNPFMLSIQSYQSTYLMVAAGWALLAVLLNADWMIEQIRSFRPRASVDSPITLDLKNE